MATKDALQIVLPTTGFRRLMLFNRFAVERDMGFVIIHFGLVNKQNFLLDSYGSAISEADLLSQRKNCMDYLGGQGAMGEQPASWQPPSEERVEVANHITMAHQGQIAETVLFSISLWSAIMELKKVKAERNLGVEAVALLRSPLAVQQHLIRLLFAKSDELLI
jgi:hypothetical protein